MSQEKIFVGYVKVEEIPMKSGGSFTRTRISFNDDHLKLLMSHLNENGYVNCNFNRSKSGNEYLEIDTWKPSGSYSSAPQQPEQYSPAPQPQQPRMVNTPMPSFDGDTGDDTPF